MGGYGRCWHPTHTPGAGGRQGGLSVVGSRRRQRTVPSGERAVPSSATDGVHHEQADRGAGRTGPKEGDPRRVLPEPQRRAESRDRGRGPRHVGAAHRLDPRASSPGGGEAGLRSVPHRRSHERGGERRPEERAPPALGGGKEPARRHSILVAVRAGEPTGEAPGGVRRPPDGAAEDRASLLGCC